MSVVGISHGELGASPDRFLPILTSALPWFSGAVQSINH